MHQSLPSEHAQHDLSLIAAHAAGDLPDAERPRADALISSCTPCADLRRDLVAITAATRSVPPPFALTRDFRLDDAQASRLRRGSWVRALLAPFGASRSVLRPIAAGVTSLGVAGLLVATMLPTALPATMPAERNDQTLSGATSSVAPEFQVAASPIDRVNAPASVGSDSKADPSSEVAVAGGVSTQGPAEDGEGNPAPTVISTPSMSPLAIASLGILALGLLLFGLRFAARRVR